MHNKLFYSWFVAVGHYLNMIIEDLGFFSLLHLIYFLNTYLAVDITDAAVNSEI